MPENVTFTRCMMRAEGTSDGLWAADLTRDMSAASGVGGLSFKELQATLQIKEVKVLERSQRPQPQM